MRISDTLPEVEVSDDITEKLKRLKEANLKEGYLGQRPLKVRAARC
jgi:hypothetical protein